MKSTLKWLASASALATAAIAGGPAFAQTVDAGGTAAGTDVTNEVTVNYKVGGFDQPEKESSVTFEVDRKIMFLVTNGGGTGVLVDTTPGKTNSAQLFNIANDTNDTIDLDLELTVQGGEFGQTASDYTFYSDAALTTEITYIDEIAPGGDATVYVVYTPAVPSASADGDQALVRLAATAHAGGGVGALGTELTETAGADVSTQVDNVFAEGEGKTDAGNTEFDGTDWDDGGFEVQTATIAVTKTSRVVSDPVNGTTGPKAIPQAVVEYCIAVANSSDTAATDVTISDPLPAQLTYDSTFGVNVGGADCTTPGTEDGTFASDTVEGTIATLNANSTQTLIFRATIN